MKCRQCGSEIADKAIVCYKCGAATTEPKFKAPPPRPSGGGWSLPLSVLAIVLLALSALYMTQFVSGGAPPMLRWIIIALAAVIVGLRLIGRRRR